MGSEARVFQMYSLLSLPPEARCCESGDHLRPHTCGGNDDEDDDSGNDYNDDDDGYGGERRPLVCGWGACGRGGRRGSGCHAKGPCDPCCLKPTNHCSRPVLLSRGV